MSRFSLQSPLRKLTDTGFFYLKENRRYVFLDVATTTDSSALFSLAYDLTDGNFPNLGKVGVKEYLEARGLPNTEGIDIVSRDSHFSNGRAILSVRSFSRDGWKEKKSHALLMDNLVTNLAPPEEKLRSFRNIGIVCTDKRSKRQTSYKPPEHVMRIFGSSSPIETVYCDHAEVGHHWLSLNYGVYGFGMHPPYFTQKVIAYVAEQVVKRNQRRLSKYRFNEQFRGEKTEIYDPLIRMAWRGQISPL